MAQPVMIPDSGLLGTIAVQFTSISLMAFGGANAVLPEMHRQAVELRGWVTEPQFADMFAISQVVPGPNVMIVTLIGFHLAGLIGALVATLAMCGPTAVLAYVLARAWDRLQGARWRAVVEAGLVPISVGLVAASAAVLTIATGTNLVAALIVLVTAGISYFTRWSPLWPLAAGALLGLAGLVH
jgi:chromate transporter